jgi:hypothetical protein
MVARTIVWIDFEMLELVVLRFVLEADGDLSGVCFGVSHVMARAASDVLEENGVFIQAQ